MARKKVLQNRAKVVLGYDLIIQILLFVFVSIRVKVRLHVAFQSAFCPFVLKTHSRLKSVSAAFSGDMYGRKLQL